MRFNHSTYRFSGLLVLIMLLFVLLGGQHSPLVISQSEETLEAASQEQDDDNESGEEISELRCEALIPVSVNTPDKFIAKTAVPAFSAVPCYFSVYEDYTLVIRYYFNLFRYCISPHAP